MGSIFYRVKPISCKTEQPSTTRDIKSIEAHKKNMLMKQNDLTQVPMENIDIRCVFQCVDMLPIIKNGNYESGNS